MKDHIKVTNYYADSQCFYKVFRFLKNKKGAIKIDSAFLYFLSLIYSTLKAIGKLYFTPTGRPRCFPGVIFGNNFTTRIASSCNLL